MKLCFDVGNTDIYSGVFDGDECVLEFRRSNQNRPSIDEFGIFLLQVLAAHGLKRDDIRAVAMASVVPDCDNTIERAVQKYLDLPLLNLRSGVRTGLKIRTRVPGQVGADRIANAIAAVQAFPDRNRVVIDMGTATTFCAINRSSEYLGGVIAAGMGLSMRALAQNTAKLPFVDIVERTSALGRDTVENIQSGIYFGHVGLIREVVTRLTDEAFDGEEPVVVATGGFARLFKDGDLFDAVIPDLVLRGLLHAIDLNEA